MNQTSFTFPIFFLILLHIHMLFTETFNLRESSMDRLVPYKFREKSEVMQSLISWLQFIYRTIN